jgi:hypothetical protein
MKDHRTKQFVLTLAVCVSLAFGAVLSNHFIWEGITPITKDTYPKAWIGIPLKTATPSTNCRPFAKCRKIGRYNAGFSDIRYGGFGFPNVSFGLIVF